MQSSTLSPNSHSIHIFPSTCIQLPCRNIEVRNGIYTRGIELLEMNISGHQAELID